MAVLTQLTLDADGTITSQIEHDAGSGSPFYTHCNDDPSTSSSDYVANDNSESSGSAFFRLTNVNSDFGNMTLLDIDVDVLASGFSNDACTITARIFDGDGAGTPLTDETGDLATELDTSRTTRTVSFAGLVGNKTQWDNAYLRLTWTYNKSGGPDNANLRIYGLDIDGTYAIFTPVVNAFRFYDDDGSESGSTQLAAQDVDITVDAATVDDIVHLRFRIDETTGGTGGTGDDWQIQYRKNAGSWLNVDGSSSNVQPAKGTAGTMPTFESNTQSIPGSLGTDITLTKPTSPTVKVDDLLVLIVYSDDTGATPEFVDNVTGWDLYDTFRGGNGAMWGAVYTRIADGTEPATVTVTSDSSTGMVGFYVVYDNTDLTNPFGANLLTSIDAAANPHTLNEITSTRDNSLILYLAGIDGDSRLPVSVASPYTERDEADQQVTSGLIGISFGEQGLATAGATGDVVLTYAGGDTGIGLVVAIQATYIEGSQLTNGGATTDRGTSGISNPGGGSFVAGGQEAQTGLVNNVQITADDFTEMVYALKLLSTNLANDDDLDFRLQLNGVTITNNVMPTITISDGGGGGDPTSVFSGFIIAGHF